MDFEINYYLIERIISKEMDKAKKLPKTHDKKRVKKLRETLW